MRRRPWPIIILALAQLLSPMISLVMSAWMVGSPVLSNAQAVLRESSFFQLFDVLGLPILSGAAIFAMKRWSYPVFLSIAAWVFYANLREWQGIRDGSLLIFVMMTTSNILLVTYFLGLKKVRYAFYHSEVRWWERKPRYQTSIQAQIRVGKGGSRKPCVIGDLSEGGAFFITQGKYKPGQSLYLSFHLLNTDFNLPCKIVYQNKMHKGFGVQFRSASPAQMARLHRLLKAFHHLGIPLRNQAPRAAEDFAHWAGMLFKSGKGLVPEYALPNEPIIKMEPYRRRKAAQSRRRTETTKEKRAA